MLEYSGMKLTPTPSSWFTKPMQFGPSIGMCAARAMSDRRRCAAAPSSRAISPYPEAYTTTPPAPAAAASVSAVSTPSRGTTSATRSGLPGSAASEG